MVNDLNDLLRFALEESRADGRETASSYREILAAQPQRWEEIYLFATALLQSKRFGEAIEVFEQLAALRRDLPDVHNNLGFAYQSLGNFDRASLAYQQALHLRSDFDRACLNLGRLKEQEGSLAEAETWYRRGAELKPDERSYWLHLAGVLGKQNKWEETEHILRRTLADDPENLDLQVNLAFALIQREQLDEAAGIYHRVLARQPHYYQIQSNLAFVRERQGRFDDALAAAQRAIELRPDYPEAHNNLGIILRSLHRVEDACRAFRKALELCPDFPLAEFNLGTTLLLAGDYIGGWKGYRHYGQIGGAVAPACKLPEWNGSSIPGKRLLVYADQGFGDTIQFARFLAGCRMRSAAQIVFSCQPALVGMFAGLSGVDVLLGNDEKPPCCDFQVPLASLPRLLGVTIDSAAAGVPYLQPPRELRPAIADLLITGEPGTARIGLVWQGNPQQTRDFVRSCPLEKLVPLLRNECATFFSLQTGDPGRLQLEQLSLTNRLVDVGAVLAEFGETAAVLSQLDLVITVDTATAHLAGAIGSPVWTMLCHTPDWRWHLKRSDSPWYPSMRLFRQPRHGDWDSVVATIEDALNTRILTKKRIFAK